MKAKEIDKIFNRITSNGCREMTEVRFRQAVNEVLYEHPNLKLNKIIEEIIKKKEKNTTPNDVGLRLWNCALNEAMEIIGKGIIKKD